MSVRELDDNSPSTTTISTVAVQSGRSKIVLAVLRVSYAVISLITFILNYSVLMYSTSYLFIVLISA